MRKALFLATGFVSALALPGRVTAQDTVVTRVQQEQYVEAKPGPRTSFGIKGGLTFATLSETNASPNFGNQTGFAAGIHLALPLGTSILMFQPEAMISQQGATAAIGGLPSEDGAFEFTYLTIPANLRVNLATGGAQPYIIGGPYAAFRLNCQFQDVDFDCDNYRDTDWGVNVGAGLKFGRTGGFFLEGRYAFGLTNINDLDEGFDSKNRAFMVLAGISF
ncbi:MAG TPA: porin family protein [Gemmatimonadales bacterium]